MVTRVDRFKVDPEFSKQMEDRQGKVPDFSRDDAQILRDLVVLIAYSNNANSEKVTRLVEGSTFEELFQEYLAGPGCTAAQEIVDASWHDLKSIRFKRKVDAWVRCREGLRSIRARSGSFMEYLDSVGLPNRIESEADFCAFWKGFDQIRGFLSQSRFPYFGNFTSLCHLLLHLGFDSVKPDLIVMKTAVELGIVPPQPQQKKNPEKTSSHPEASLKQTVQSIQRYSVYKGTRPAVLDLYFLIHGRQASSIALVRPDYYQNHSRVPQVSGL
jgi:hypothetical protein